MISDIIIQCLVFNCREYNSESLRKKIKDGWNKLKGKLADVKKIRAMQVFGEYSEKVQRIGDEVGYRESRRSVCN